ncbi:O-antigen ligase family protein, partial [Kineococcus indalonis]|uniref:O-antigen ligase family protein n=1 Tax=Kineococcus indalonis TaxID=2696566 RepID=UPI001411F036
LLSPRTAAAALGRAVADPLRALPARQRPLRVSWLPVAVVVCAFTLPGNFVVPGPLKSNGSPVRLLSLVCLGLAVLTFLAARRRRADDAEPRWSLVGAVLVLGVAEAFWSYGVAMTSALDAAESAGALRSLVGTFGTTGLALYLWLVLRRRDDRDRVLGWVVAAAALSAVVAAASWAGVLPGWASLVRGAGLVENTPTLGEVSRFDFLRARGTGEHPIEYSLGLAAALPIALHLARHAATAAARRWSALAVVIIVAGLPLSVSRTAVLGLVVGLAVAVSGWPARQKLGALLTAAAGVTAMFVLVPDLVRSLTQIFTLAEQDDSVTGRLSDYALVEAMFREHPWLGMGAGVYRPETGGVYLDNTFLGTLIGGGVVGVAVFALQFLVAGAVAWDRSVLDASAAERSLDRALLAVLAVVLVGAVTSDVTSFQQPTVLLTLVLGLLASRAGRPGPGAAGPGAAVPAGGAGRGAG